ncbi:MAG TPA: S53 family peptidase [Ktedonobacterales bacterium]|nr:S53 family peptidase [Ktedonobacterales bacterium]
MKRSRKLAFIVGLMATLAIVAGASVHFVYANPGNGTSNKLSGNTPEWVSKAQNLGAADASQTIDLTVWLKLRNEGQLQQQLHDLYTPSSSSYHQWLSQSQFDASYSPTAQQANAVANFLTAHGFTILDTAENNFYIKVSGTIGQAEQAFHVQINNYRYQGKTYRSNAADPSVNDPAGGNIANVTGLDSASYYQPANVRPANHGGDGTSPNNAVIWQVLCGNFNTQKTLSLVDGTSQTYTGFVPCGYNGDQLRTAYGLDKLPAGVDGSGQTVAITDAYGSPTVLTDANKFSQVAGLPPLVMGENFDIVTPNGITNVPETPAQDPFGWQAEVTLDVEAVHAMAPGAKIVLVASPNNYSDLDEAVNWITIHHLANIVTNSWGLSVDLMDPGQATRDERIFMQAAAEGIGLNFSSGDGGDELAFTGHKTVDYPASSPWVNAVGGTSLFLNSDKSYRFETGWGTNLKKLYGCVAYSVNSSTGLRECTKYDPSLAFNYGFDGGAGGGLSYNFQAQPWQTSAIGSTTAAGFGTVGTHRALPDISMLADPYTGMNVWITDLSAGDTAPEVEPYGGTSLASPLFAGIMALVDQQRAAHGMGPAGLASQYVYNLPAGAVHDVTNPSGVGNPVSGDPSAFSLYYGSRYSGSFFNPAFNEDSSLALAPGWDDVTGVGSPNAPNFVAALS